MVKKALITGIAGQDGFYLAQFLLQKGYQVYGFTRNLQFTLENVSLSYGDLTYPASIEHALRQVHPDEIYHLAALSSPRKSWAQPIDVLRVNAEGAILVFEAARKYCPQAKIYQASSGEMFGNTSQSPQHEKTSFAPSDPYAISKCYAHHMARVYREQHNRFIACGILFHHESERRPLHYVTQKIAYGAACARLGIIDSPHLNEIGRPIVQKGKLGLGDLKVQRDWGCAQDYVQAMWLMLQQEDAEDYVIGTGKLHTLAQLCEMAYQTVGLDWQQHVKSDPCLKRHSDPQLRCADPTKAKQKLKWESMTSIETVMARMVQSQIHRLTPWAMRRQITEVIDEVYA